MSKLALLGGVVALGAVAVYAAGVYYTGYTVENRLENLNFYLNSEPNLKHIIENYELNYTLEVDNFFDAKGTLQFISRENRSEKVGLKLEIKKKFLTALINFDLPHFYSQLDSLNDEQLFAGLRKETVKSKAYFKVNLFPQSSTFHYDLAGDYPNQEYKPLQVQFDLSVEGDEECKNSFLLKHIYTVDDDGPISFEQLSFLSEFQGFPMPRDMGKGSLMLGELQSTELQLGELELDYKAGKLDKNGTFPLEIKLEVDEIKNQLKDLVFKVNLNGLNLNIINEALNLDELNEEEQKKILSSIKEFNIEQFDFKLLPAALKYLKTLGGGSTKDEVKVNISGKLTHDGSVTAEGVSGSFKIESDEDLSGGVFMQPEQDLFKADLEFNSGKLTVNGKELF